MSKVKEIMIMISMIEKSFKLIKTEKCDNCKNWKFGCELSGSFRRQCKNNNFKDYNPKN